MKVIDNFLNQELFSELRDVAYGKDIFWTEQATSPELEQREVTFEMGMVYKPNFWSLENKELFYRIFDKIQEHLSDDYLPRRVYFNRQPPTVDGSLHQDDGDYTALLYVSDYHKDWGGFTQLWHSDTKQEYILPIPNRLLLFESSIYHKGFGFSHKHNPERISLAYKITNEI